MNETRLELARSRGEGPRGDRQQTEWGSCDRVDSQQHQRGDQDDRPTYASERTEGSRAHAQTDQGRNG